MKKYLYIVPIIFIFIFMLVLSSCYRITRTVGGDSITKEYEALDANEFEIKDIHLKRDNILGYGPTIIFNEGETKKISMEFQEGLAKVVKVEFKNNKLLIHAEKFLNYDTNCDFIINITGYKFDNMILSSAVDATINSDSIINNDLATINISGASEVKIGDVNIKDLTCNISGASNLKINNLNSTRLNLGISGASTFDIKGNSYTLDAQLSGASSFKSRDFVTDNAKVELSGASNMEITVNQAITGSLSGASNLKYSGEAAVSVDTSGASQINKI